MRRLLLLAGAVLLAGGAAASEGKVIASIDLARPFAARSPWRLTATQGPEGEGVAGNQEPGKIVLCLSKDAGRSCDPGLAGLLLSGEPDYFSDPHYLDAPEIVHPAPGRSLLLLRVASVHSGNGNQRVAIRLLAYDPAKDSFVTAYAQRTGRNNNEEVRYVADGTLKGAVIFAEPTSDAPFGYWISVSRPDAALRYRQVLRFRSATLYGDGNPLAAIDSEMPNLQQRLGLWRPGKPLPLPAGRACPKPHLVKTVLWCG